MMEWSSTFHLSFMYKGFSLFMAPTLRLVFSEWNQLLFYIYNLFAL